MSDRDRRTPKTPPHGIAAQLAPEAFPRKPTEDEFAGDTGNVPAYENADDDTPVGLPAMEAKAAVEDALADRRLRHRVKEIKQTVETTHVGIDTLRFETKKDIGRLENRITLVASEVSGQMASVKAHVEGVKAELVTKLDANTAITKIVADQLPVLQKTVLDALASDRKLTREEEHWRTKQTLEVNAHEAKAEIDDAAKKREWWRNISGKAISAALGLIGTGAVAGWIITHLAC